MAKKSTTPTIEEPKKKSYIMNKYDKLVRDKIPDIIKKEGSHPCFVKLTDMKDTSFSKYLHDKLNEELNEYKIAKDDYLCISFSSSNEEKTHDKEIEELVDVVEVIYAISETLGVSTEEFEKRRLEKLEKCGGFKDRTILGVSYDVK